MSDTFFYNVTPTEIALKVAFDGNIPLFDAIVVHTGIDVASIAIFRMLSERRQGYCYLVFELLARGDLSMLRHLVEKYGFSLRVREEHCAKLTEAYAAQRCESSRVAIEFHEDSAALWLRRMCVYPYDSLVEYGMWCVKKANPAERAKIEGCITYINRQLATA